jgi:phospholipid/cholesterol/gamma-HCH transport system substrate-binding protein
MEPDSRYTLVGALFLGLVGLLVAGLVWLSGDGSDSTYRFYTIRFEQQSLDGLQQGSDVNMRGVKVGRVTAYQLSPVNANEVEVTIQVGRGARVSENTSAVVSRNFVTGMARIDLVTPGTPGPELVIAPAGERFPRIPEGRSDLRQIADSIGRLTDTGEAALVSVTELLSQGNRESVMDTVSATRDLLRSLDKRLDGFDRITDSTLQTLGSFRKAATAFEGTARALEQSGRDASTAVLRMAGQLDPMLAQTTSALADVSSAARALERESAAIVAQFEAAADSGAMELRVTARELRSSIESLGRAAERLRDPTSVLLGPASEQLGPGEGK